MTAYSTSWEPRLFALAQCDPENEPGSEAVNADAAALARAYACCDAIAQQHSHTFYTASRLLPAEKRRAIRSLYAFCRITDDLIDRAQGNLAEGLAAWRMFTMVSPPPPDNPVALAWADTRRRYQIPARYADQLVQGVAADLTKQRYATFEELAVYCYGVASTVGLMSMHIIGFSGRDAIPYAVKLGVAMQVTNILRDVQEDWDAGRVYLPQDELAAFELSDADIAARVSDARWRAFMLFQVERNRQLYAEAMPGIARLAPSGRFAIAAAAELYRALLDDIEAHDYDVFGHSARLSTFGKVRRLPGAWWRVRRITYEQGHAAHQGSQSESADVAGQVSAASMR